MKNWIVSVVFLFFTAIAGARELTIKTTWSLDTRPAGAATDKPHLSLQVVDKATGAIPAGFYFKRTDSAVKAGNFIVTDDKDKPVAFTVVYAPAKDVPGEGRKGRFKSIKLYPTGSDTPKKARVTIINLFDLALAAGDTVDESYRPGTIESSDDALSFRNAQPRNRLALKAGKSAAVSFDTQYFYEWKEDIGGIHLGLKGDTTIQTVAEADYFNNLEAFVKLSWGSWFDHNLGIALLEFETKTESDRGFEVINQTVGLKTSITWNNSFVQAINGLFVGPPRKDNLWREHYQLPPLIVLGYDYAAKIKKEEEPSRTVGEHRIVARLLWTIPIVRGWDIPDLPLVSLKSPDQRLNIDLVADIEGIYDIEQSHFSPKIKVDLDFYLMNAGAKPPALGKRGSFILSYANGESAPRFENVSEFLAGFKYQF